VHKEWTSLVPTQLSCTLTLVIQMIRSLIMLLIMEEIRRLQAQLRRMRQKGFPAADYYQLWLKIERLKYQLALGLFPDVGD
jgi:hypothetical protein